MTDRERQLIEAYLPHPRDPELEDGEYFVRDLAGRVRKVYVRNIFPHEYRTEYGVHEVGTNRRIDAGYGSEFRGFRMGHLYDNRQDCKDYTHDMYDDWERLRDLQKEYIK